MPDAFRKEGLDSSAPDLRIIFVVLAEGAREEAQDIAWRTQKGKDAHKALGEWWQRRIVPFGLERAPEKRAASVGRSTNTRSRGKRARSLY